LSRSVLIFGEHADRHVCAVADALRAGGAEPLVFDFTKVPVCQCRLAYTLDDQRCVGAVCIDRRWHDWEAIRAVWWRVKLVPGTPAEPAVDFALREWRSALEALEAFSGDTPWVNPRTADNIARHKPAQLRVASEVGLSIPRTLISNDPRKAAAFVEASEGQCIYKVLTWYFVPPNQWIFTSPVDPGSLRTDAEAVEIAPCLFQELVPKAYELRVTVIGDRTFPVRIDSQARPDTRLDWRRNQYAVPYAPTTISPSLQLKLLAMNARLGLAFGAYDLIVTPDERVVFLEVNPMGQWLWLEKITGVPITEAVCDHLLAADRGPSSRARPLMAQVSRNPTTVTSADDSTTLGGAAVVEPRRQDEGPFPRDGMNAVRPSESPPNRHR
jgi:hypothetical protein